MADLTDISAIAGALLRQTSAPERRKLLRAMARELQASQRARIARQQAPDGTAFAPRRPKPVAPADSRLRRRGTIRRGAMFRKLRLARNLQTGVTDSEAWVGFVGRAARIALVHQEGAMDRPSPRQRPVRYERRQLLGLTPAEEGRLLDLLLQAVSPQ